MKTKIALKRIMLLTLATFIFTVVWADEKKVDTENANQSEIIITYTLDGADDYNYFLRDPGVDQMTNDPEPFSSSTSIKYNLKRNGYVNLAIYFGDIKFEIFARDYQKEGSHMVEFDAAGLPPGVYICELIFENKVIYETMVKKAPFSQKKYLEN